MSETGFMGVGIMGRPMAGHLHNARHELSLVKHRSPLPAANGWAGMDRSTLVRAIELLANPPWPARRPFARRPRRSRSTCRARLWPVPAGRSCGL